MSIVEDKIHRTNPIYLGVAVWGRSFCESFVNLALASLLAEGNIPALDNSSGRNCFLIYTTEEDMAWMEAHPLLKQLKRFMQVEFMVMSPISEQAYKKLNNSLSSSKLYTMTLGHRQILNRMYADKAVGSIVLADSVYSNKSIYNAYQHIIGGKTAVMVFCPRFSTNSLVDELVEQKYVQSGLPVTIESRDLIKVAMNNMHIDMLMQQWEAPYLPEFMLEAGWLLPDKSGMIFHTWSCWCAFINYNLLLSHNTDSLGNNTIDGVYFGANLKKEDAHFITDSDEFTLISFSPHIHRKLVPIKVNGDLPKKKIINFLKIVFVKQFLKRSAYTHTDPFKLEFARQPIFMHTQDITQSCHALKAETNAIIEKVLTNKSTLFGRAMLYLNESYCRDKVTNKIVSIYKRSENSVFVRYHQLLAKVVDVFKILRKWGGLLVRYIQILLLEVTAKILKIFLTITKIKKSKLEEGRYFPIPKSYLENNKN